VSGNPAAAPQIAAHPQQHQASGGKMKMLSHKAAGCEAWFLERQASPGDSVPV
jgi:hypothetical protein